MKHQVEHTVYSLSEDAPPPPDQRNGERYLSLLRVGALQIDGRHELCLVRNISAGGMLIRPYSTIAAGTALSVELKHGDMVSGVARWDNLAAHGPLVKATTTTTIAGGGLSTVR